MEFQRFVVRKKKRKRERAVSVTIHKMKKKSVIWQTLLAGTLSIVVVVFFFFSFFVYDKKFHNNVGKEWERSEKRGVSKMSLLVALNGGSVLRDNTDFYERKR